MKRKITIINISILLVTSIILFISFFVFLNNFNLKNEKQEITNYLNIVCEIYDGSNNEEVGEAIKKVSSNLRLTIISKDGEVLYDSLINGVLESHLDRPEIVNLGTISYRYSTTLNTKMLYIAAFDDGNYLRVALEANDINQIITSLLIVEGIIFILIIVFSSLMISKANKKIFEPIKNEMNKLSNIVGEDESYYSDDINVISNNINRIQLLINEKVDSLEKEKDKINYIINSIKQGIIILDGKGVITLINDYALEIFNPQMKILNNHYLYLFRDSHIQELIEEVKNKQTIQTYEVQANEKNYLMTFSPFHQNWLEDYQNGILISIIDISYVHKINKMKRDFFANASHELKSPLTTIIGYQQLLANDLISDEKEKNNAINKTIKEANRMNNIIKDMLDIARLEADIKRNYTQVSIKQIILDILDSYDQEIKKANLRIDLNLNDTIINGDESDLTKLIKNIIDNAIKYNRIDGFISITLNKKKLSIEDGGIGIKKEDLEHIFERFYRVDKSKSKELLGTGLGLSIVKHICQTYKYSLNFESEFNKGSKITIIFNE